MRIKPPAPPYAGPPAHFSEGDNKPIDRVVIHSTVSPCKPGGARQIAAYFRSESAGGSAHYVTDPAETIQAAYDSVICWHAPPNPNTLGLEMCDIPGPAPDDNPGTARFKAARRAWRWVRPGQRAMLKRTAELTAELCLAYDVPTKYLSARAMNAAVRAGRTPRGVTTHAQTSLTWRQSTHWDPGFWPRRRFMRLVRRHVKGLSS